LHPVGRLHRDRSHPVLAEMLLDLDDDVDILGLDADRVVDLRQMPACELHVHDRADDLHDLADFLCFCDCHVIVPYCPLPTSRFQPVQAPPLGALMALVALVAPNYSASAPETSIISRVIAACLTLLTARGAPPPLALARRLRASLGPQALFIYN